jgi:iron complex transport system substrate-binding protein
MRLLLCAVLLSIGTVQAQVRVTDDYGYEVVLKAPAQRIVSLSPHLTELLYAAGAGAKVVGAVDYSDFPPEARKLPRVGGDVGIDLEAVLALRPDLIVAWPNAGSLRAVNRLAELGIPTFRSEPRELDAIPTTIEKLGALAGTSSNAAASFRERVDELQKRYSQRPTVRVFYQVWDRPLQTINGDHVISKVIRLCGGENVFAAAPTIAPEIDREALLRARPEVTITSIATSPPPAYFIPGELIQRHTPRLLEGAERLCRILEAARTAR